MDILQIDEKIQAYSQYQVLKRTCEGILVDSGDLNCPHTNDELISMMNEEEERELIDEMRGSGITERN